MALLRKHQQAIYTIYYLDTPPDAATIKHILDMLNFSDPRALMRTHESEYQALNLASPNLSHDELIHAMVKHPHLIERPIVTKGQKAAIGRPPESVLAIL